MFEQVVQWLVNDWAPAIFNPQKRLYWLYLLSALLMAFFWLAIYKRRGLLAALSTVFNRQLWLSKSAQADYMLTAINAFLMSLLAPRLLGSSAVAYALFTWLHTLPGGRNIWSDLSAGEVAMTFTLFLFIIDDFARYIVHRLLHRSRILWLFHKVHHSATVLNPLTVLRTHPVEAVLFSFRGALVQGFCIALFVYMFGERVSLVTVLGANAINVLFNLLGSNLRHSPIAIGYWPAIEKIFMSPAQHQIHHSIDTDHHDKNFGVALSLWDYLFGTHCYSSANQSLSYGVPGGTQNPHSLASLYWVPFREAGLLIAETLRLPWLRNVYQRWVHSKKHRIFTG